jgi:hypothetical protein
VKFAIGQSVDVAPDVAVAAYGNPAFYEGRPPRDNISVTEVVSHNDTGSQVLIEVRFKFSGSVNSAVRAVVDPSKMSWITRTTIQPSEHRTTFDVLSDNYPDRLSCHGTFHFTDGAAGPDSSVINVEGELKVHVPIVGRTVERVIVSGLRNYLAAEVAGLPDFSARG